MKKSIKKVNIPYTVGMQQTDFMRHRKDRASLNNARGTQRQDIANGTTPLFVEAAKSSINFHKTQGMLEIPRTANAQDDGAIRNKTLKPIKNNRTQYQTVDLD